MCACASSHFNEELLQALVNAADELEQIQRHPSDDRAASHPTLHLASSLTEEIACALSGADVPFSVTGASSRAEEAVTAAAQEGRTTPLASRLAVPFVFSSSTNDTLSDDPRICALLNPDPSRSRLSEWIVPFWAPLLYRWSQRKRTLMVRLLHKRHQTLTGAASLGGVGGDGDGDGAQCSHAQWQKMEKVQRALAKRLSEAVLQLPEGGATREAVRSADIVHARAAAVPATLTSSGQGKTEDATASHATTAKKEADEDVEATAPCVTPKHVVEELRQQLNERVCRRRAMYTARKRCAAHTAFLFGHLARATQSFEVLCRGAATLLQFYQAQVLNEIHESLDDVYVAAVLTHLDALDGRPDGQSTAQSEDAAAVRAKISVVVQATVRARVTTCLVEAWAILLLYAHTYGDAQLYNDTEYMTDFGTAGDGIDGDEQKKASQVADGANTSSPTERCALVHAVRTTALNESLWVYVFNWVHTQRTNHETCDGASHAVDAQTTEERGANNRAAPSFAEIVANYLSSGVHRVCEDGVDDEASGWNMQGSLVAELARDARRMFLARLEAALRVHASCRLFQAHEAARLRPALCLPLNISPCQEHYGRWPRAWEQLSQHVDRDSSEAVAELTAARMQWTATRRLLSELLRVACPNEENAWARALSSTAMGWAAGSHSGGSTSEAVVRMTERYTACMSHYWSPEGGGHVALRGIDTTDGDSHSETFCRTLYEFIGLAEAVRADASPRRCRSLKRARSLDEAQTASDVDIVPSDVTALLRTDAITPATVYWANEFFPMYHASCFVALRPERQRPLTRHLTALHATVRLLVAAGAGPERGSRRDESTQEGLSSATRVQGDTKQLITAVPEDDAVWSTSSDDDDNECEVARADHPRTQTRDAPLTKDSASEVATLTASSSAALLSLVVGEARLVVFLVHTLLLLQERKAAIAPQDAKVLHEDVVPVLALLAHKEAELSAVARGVTSFVSSSSVPPLAPPPTLEAVQFCLLASLNAELTTIPWSVEGLYLSLQRYYSLCERVVTDAEGHVSADVRLAQSSEAQRHHARIAAAVQQLAKWLAEGGAPARSRTPGSDIGALCDDVDADHQRLDPLYHRLATGAVSGVVLRAYLRQVTPVGWPAPCGALFVISMYRTMHTRLCCLRHDWDVQQQRVEEDATGYEYVGRTFAFCAQDDVHTFAALVRTLHHMLFGFSGQPVWLLRLWLGYLVHLFVSLVPAASTDVDAVALKPSDWCRRQEATREVDLFGDRKAWDGWRAVTFKTENLSSQTSLRIALGEALADLALLPLADPEAIVECPSAFPFLPFSEAAQAARRAQWMEEVATLQRTLPHTVCELLCLFLEVDLGAAPDSSPATSSATASHRRGANFLGLHGLVAFCRQLEKNTVPASSTDERLKTVLSQLWGFATQLARGR